MENEEYIDISFPLKGMDVSGPYSEQRPGTTAMGVNVRGTDPILERDRGGSRVGLIKYPNDQVPAGSFPIQHVTTFVVFDPNFLLPAFEDFEPDFVNNDPNFPDFWYPPGGNGFTPQQGMPQPPRRRVQVTVSTPTQTNGSNVTVTALLNIYNTGVVVAGSTVRLMTLPRGRDGDGDTAVTGVDGKATFTVNEASYNGQIRYIVFNTYTPPP